MSTPVKVSNRQIRKAVNNQASVVEAHRETLRHLVNDELVTRKRLDALEKQAEVLMLQIAWYGNLTLWGRLRWVVRGYRG